jgi:hypothetical protein
MRLEIACGYEGSNPQNADRVEWLSERAVRVRPECEDGDSNFKFAFDITVQNRAGRPLPLELEVDWQEPRAVWAEHMNDRRSIHVQHDGAAWGQVDGQVEEDKVRFDLMIPPGASHLCLQIPFGSRQLEEFFQQVVALGDARRVSVGQTGEGRQIEAAVLPSLERPEHCLLALGRIHSYESAASYFVHGMLDLLASSRGEELRRRRAFVLVPLANPDGAANGLCKRTARGGVDLGPDANTSSDPTACALRGLIAGLAAASPRPEIMQVGSWMYREDCLWGYQAGLVQDIRARIDDDVLFPNDWRLMDRSDLEPDPSTADLTRYAVWALGMKLVGTETPWYDRSPAIVRRIGGVVTEAILQTLEETE